MSIITAEIKQSIENSVLCWLATVSTDGIPNVSPKEVFCDFGDEMILIANIASPQSLKNIMAHPQVSVSFVDILVQKGYQLKGKAKIIRQSDSEFAALSIPLKKIATERFPFASLFAIRVNQVKSILAPSYILYPQTTEANQIANAKRRYGFTQK